MSRLPVGALYLTCTLLFTGACSTAPETGSADDLQIVVLSDLNSSYGSTRYESEVRSAVARTIQTWKPALVLIAGDMIAGQRATLTDENVRAMWTAFDSIVAAPLRAAGIPLAVTVGNHDASGFPAHARDRQLAREYWREPAHALAIEMAPGSNYPLYYAFAMRSVFFIVLDASTGRMIADTAQLQWLERTLSSPDARNARARIALGHVPLYAVAEGRNQAGEVQDQPDSLRTLLERGRVALFVSGHHHAYYPGRRGALDLLHAGALGEGARPLIGSTLAPYKSVTVLTVPARRGTIIDRTYRIYGNATEPVDIRTLPLRLEG